MFSFMERPQALDLSETRRIRRGSRVVMPKWQWHEMAENPLNAKVSKWHLGADDRGRQKMQPRGLASNWPRFCAGREGRFVGFGEEAGGGGGRWGEPLGVGAAWENASRGKMGTKGGESRRPGTSPPGGMHLRGGDWQRRVQRGAGVVPEGLLEPSVASFGTLFANCFPDCRVRRLRSRVSALRCRLVQFPALSRMEFQP